MSKLLPLNISVQGLFKLTDNKTGLPIFPVSYSNIVFQSQNAAIVGLLSDSAPGTMDFLITGPGSTLMTIFAQCSYKDPKTGNSVTTNQQKVLAISVSGSEPGWIVTLN